LKNKLTSLKHHLDQTNIKNISNANLAGYTTIGVGGKAMLAAIADTSLQLEQAVCWAIRLEVPYLVIGKGSNLIISDEGYEGIVIINKSKYWQIIEVGIQKDNLNGMSRMDSTLNKKKYRDADKRKKDFNVLVSVDSGMQVRSLTNVLYRNGITGLQWFAGIPASVGGAIYMNMHGGSYFFGDIVNRVLLLSGTEKKTVNRDYFKFAYDYSILHQTKEIVLCTELILKKGDVNKARREGKNWARQKSFQPQRSAGCIFRNLTVNQQRKLNISTDSTGYVVDKLLKLSGTRIGDAVISNRHAAFIENIGNAKAADVYRLIQLIRTKAKEELQINLELEAQLVGNFE
jgi:UDP-N-acetylenolpyruvoylglucosamine reductase